MTPQRAGLEAQARQAARTAPVSALSPFDSTTFTALSWRNVGPWRGGRAVAVAGLPSNPMTYFAGYTGGGLWRTDDAGQTWRTVNRDPNINFRPFYYADIRVDPKNPNKLFALSGSLYLSEDGGTTFRTIARDVHGDHQAMWIDPVPS